LNKNKEGIEKGGAPGLCLEGKYLITLGHTLLVNIPVLESVNRSVGHILTVLYIFHIRVQTRKYEVFKKFLCISSVYLEGNVENMSYVSKHSAFPHPFPVSVYNCRFIPQLTLYESSLYTVSSSKSSKRRESAMLCVLYRNQVAVFFAAFPEHMPEIVFSNSKSRNTSG
jgi:hypothetical protein